MCTWPAGHRPAYPPKMTLNTEAGLQMKINVGWPRLAWGLDFATYYDYFPCTMELPKTRSSTLHEPSNKTMDSNFVLWQCVGLPQPYLTQIIPPSWKLTLCSANAMIMAWRLPPFPRARSARMCAATTVVSSKSSCPPIALVSEIFPVVNRHQNGRLLASHHSCRHSRKQALHPFVQTMSRNSGLSSLCLQETTNPKAPSGDGPTPLSLKLA